MADALSSPGALLVLLITVVVVATTAILLLYRAHRRVFSSLERATFSTLHTVSLATPTLREGLSKQSASFALPYLRTMLEASALTMTDSQGNTLGWDGDADHHIMEVEDLARRVVATGRQQVMSHTEINCDRPDCLIKGVAVVPLQVEDNVTGTLGAVSHSRVNPVLLRTTGELARYVSSQLELAELDESRARLSRAEVRALRAQISPHFIYNALTTISSLIRTEPDRARELLAEFADFTRYSFRAAGEYTTLQDELTNIGRYLMIERARFGERLDVRVRIAPEVLPVVLPFLALQPLVENAVRHGLAGKPGGGSVTVTAENAGSECVIVVEDDGVGMEASRLREDLGDEHLSGAHVGLGNVDERLRSAFGNDFGLAVDTAPGAGMKITLKVPKFRAGVGI